MTMPDERYRAVRNTEKFLLDLLNPKKTPRVPKRIREQAHSLLRHYPSKYDMDVAATMTPSVFEAQEQIDPVTIMIYDYEAKISK